MVVKKAATTKRPASVRIGPHTYAIKYDDAAVNAAAIEIDRSINGFSDHNEHVIGLPIKGYAESALRGTLMHELLHCVLALSASWYKVVEQGKDAEESMIQSSAQLLLGVMRDNPAVVAYLTEV